VRNAIAAIHSLDDTMTAPGLTVVNTVATALLTEPGERGVASALAALERAGIRAELAGGTLVLGPSVDPEVRSVLESMFALAAARLDSDELVAVGKLTALGSLSTSVVHEINNPLFAILGLVEFLLRDAEPGTKAHSRLDLIQTTGFEIKEIARALLDFARERPGELETVQLDEAAQTVARLFGLTAAAKGVDVVERLEHVAVLGRRGELRQLLLCLLLNAKQALPDGGTVTIEVRREGDTALLRVTDTGPGVPAELGERAFDAFVTTREAVGALGLGLTVARLIARRHGGELVLEPSETGACFAARLPLSRSDRP
jgi:two-component system sensor histidine kinase HydH